MVKKCIYCGCEISDNCVIDFCEKCGKGVWGEKMFNAIVQNMENARANGDLCHSQNFPEAIQSKDFEQQSNSFSF